MARVPVLEREQLAPEHRPIYDEIASSRGRVGGNFKAMLNSPVACQRLAALGEYLRFGGPVPNAVKEVAILAAARQADSDYVWTAHEALARKAGVKPPVIDAIRSRKIPEGSADEAAVVRYVWQLLKDHRVDDDAFGQVHRRWGDQGAVDLTLLACYYTTMSLATTVLGVAMEPGVPSTLTR